jgi:hypothetical protein
MTAKHKNNLVKKMLFLYGCSPKHLSVCPSDRLTSSGGKTDRHMDGHTYGQTNKHNDGQTNRNIEIKTDGQMERWKDRSAEKW